MRIYNIYRQAGRHAHDTLTQIHTHPTYFLRKHEFSSCGSA